MRQANRSLLKGTTRFQWAADSRTINRGGSTKTSIWQGGSGWRNNRASQVEVLGRAYSFEDAPFFFVKWLVCGVFKRNTRQLVHFQVDTVRPTEADLVGGVASADLHVCVAGHHVVLFAERAVMCEACVDG